VCPVDADVATAVPTVVHFSEAPRAAAAVEGDGTPRRVDVPSSAVDDWIRGEAGEGAKVIEVGVPARLLASGLELVDLPGTGGLGAGQAATVAAASLDADGVLFVTDAGQELTASESGVVEQARRRGLPVALVESRIDMHPAWRRIAELDVAHVRPLGPVPVLAAAALLGEDEQGDSGLDSVSSWLRRTHKAHTLAEIRQVLDTVGRSTAELRSSFQAELRALDDPDEAARRLVALEAAERRAAAVKAGTARWPQVLADMFADLANDLDHDLRLRTRDLVREAEEAVDRCDPAKEWTSFEPAFRRSVVAAVTEHYETLGRRIRHAVEAVVAAFGDEEEVVAALLADAPSDQLDAPELGDRGPVVDPRSLKRAGVPSQALALVRAGYGGSLMVGFLGGVAGVALAAPAALAIGVVLGGKGVRQEQQRQLAQRRAAAKTAARKYVDDVVFTVAKESRDAVRRAQRTTRDHVHERAQALHRATTEALAVARDESAADEPGRTRRRAVLTDDLGRVDAIERLVAQVAEAVGVP
jgi:hypothetical protein